jgi:vacuolar-type H+-ATPase subunit I/STV1
MAKHRQRKNKKKSSPWLGNIIAALLFLFFIIGICSPLLVAFWPMDSGHFLISDVWNYELPGGWSGAPASVGDLVMFPVCCLVLLILLAVLLVVGTVVVCVLLGTPIGQITLLAGTCWWLTKDR